VGSIEKVSETRTISGLILCLELQGVGEPRLSDLLRLLRREVLRRQARPIRGHSAAEVLRREREEDDGALFGRQKAQRRSEKR